MMNLLVKYFWLIAAIVNSFNWLLIQFRVNRIVQRNPELLAESKRLMRGLGIFLVLPFFLLSILQWAGHFDNALYISSLNYTNLYIVLSWSVFILLYIGILYWVLVRDGAKILIKFRTVFRNMPENETLVKLLTLVMVMGGSFALYTIITANAYKGYS
jgi:hypothetical protein